MTKIITFHAPKCGGSTTLSMNTAMAYQWQNQGKKVALLELSADSDMKVYTRSSHQRSWRDLDDFYKTSEWSSALLSQIKLNVGVDVFFSGSFRSVHNFTEIFDLIMQAYDVVFIDVSNNFETDDFKFVLSKTELLFLVSCLDPISLNRLSCFMSSNKTEELSCKVLFNQCPSSGLAGVQKEISKLNLDLGSIFPQDEKALWSQLFEGIPVISHKRSPLAKAIGEFASKINNF